LLAILTVGAAPAAMAIEPIASTPEPTRTASSSTPHCSTARLTTPFLMISVGATYRLGAL
jgi:hypothetical protein